MNPQKTSKRTLTVNIMILLVCIAMLILATYAWFTDSASTKGNKIQAGNLDVALEMKQGDTWVSAEGKTIDFIKQDDSAILWEPGCTYTLPELKVSNEGNLALKYKIQITGINGSAKLNEVIDWTMNDAALSDAALETEQSLAAGESNTFTISGHMQETAGNDYQGLSIDGISISVIATQDTAEADSNGTDYDAKAVYPVAPAFGSATETGIIWANEETTLGNMSDSVSPSAAQITIPAGAVAVDTPAVFKVDLTASNPDSNTYEISLTDESGQPIALSQAAVVTTKISSGLSNVTVDHAGTAMTKVASDSALTDSTFYYNSSTGQWKICTSTFSPFTIQYQFIPSAAINGTGYTSVQSAISNAQDGDVISLTEDTTLSVISTTKDVTLDLNGKTLTFTDANGIQVFNEANVTIENGTIDAAKHAITVFYSDNQITLDNVTIHTDYEYGYGVYVGSSDSTVTVKNSEIDTNYIGLSGTSSNNTYVIDGSIINANYFGIYQNGSYGANSYTITNSKISDTAHTGIYLSNSVETGAQQTLILDNCTVSAPTAVEIKHTNAQMTNSTLIGTGEDVSYRQNDNGACTVGYSLAVTTNGENDLVTGNVAVSGCTFLHNADAGYVVVANVADGASVTIDGNAVSGYNTYTN